MRWWSGLLVCVGNWLRMLCFCVFWVYYEFGLGVWFGGIVVDG